MNRTRMAAAAAAAVLMAGIGSTAHADDEPDHDLMIETLAGTGQVGNTGDGGAAVQARLDRPNRVAAGPDGTVYISSGGLLRAVAPDGVISTVAEDADLAVGAGLAVGPDETVYLAEPERGRVQAIDPDGTVHTVAGGSPSRELAGDESDGDGGLATEAMLRTPNDVAAGPDGTVYISEDDAERIRAVAPDGTISTVSWSRDAGEEDTLVTPTAIATGPDGMLYVAEGVWRRVVAIDPDAGTQTVAVGRTDSSQVELDIEHDLDVAVGADGSLYISDQDHIHGVDLDSGEVQTFGDQGGDRLGDGGSPFEARFGRPTAVTVDPDGTVFYADMTEDRVRAIRERPDGEPARDPEPSDMAISTYAGTGEQPSDTEDTEWFGSDWFEPDPYQLDVDLVAPWAVAVGPDDAVYVADGAADVRAIEPDGTVRSVVDVDEDDQLSGPPGGLAINADGSELYLTNRHEEDVRAVDPDGDVVWSVRNELSQPGGVAVAADGTVYVADTGNDRVCVVVPEDQRCATVAGRDDGPQHLAQLLRPRDVAVGPDGIVYITDTGNARVRAYDPNDESLSIVAGTGDVRLPVEGERALRTEIGVPEAVAVGTDGTLYVTDIANHRVYTIDPEHQAVRTIAGSGEWMDPDQPPAWHSDAYAFEGLDVRGPALPATGGFDGDDGPAVDAELQFPRSLAVDDAGVVYVADAGNARVRAIGAVELPPRKESGGGFLVPGLIAGAVGLLALGGLVVWLVRSGRAGQLLRS